MDAVEQVGALARRLGELCKDLVGVRVRVRVRARSRVRARVRVRVGAVQRPSAPAS